ncbi:hypothetical protein DPMN_007089 [Dreissena polymorpha]|uniref:Uncharacterized protein n=1 Tax=Dreissena polymorpha TaxID=45954 RepID=A0A9D4RVZ7_DREPO|nr:hypothetical protein DPMN_007089 [Dreissena polymorpha]
MSILFHYPFSFSSDGLDVELSLAFPGEQSCTESRACPNQSNLSRLTVACRGYCGPTSVAVV